MSEAKKKITPSKPVAKPAVAETVVAVDPIANLTHVSNAIQSIENAITQVDGWLNTHVKEVADEVRKDLISARAKLGKQIGLVTDEVGNLVNEGFKESTDGLKEDFNTDAATSSSVSPAPHDVVE